MTSFMVILYLFCYHIPVFPNSLKTMITPFYGKAYPGTSAVSAIGTYRHLSNRLPNKIFSHLILFTY